MSATKTEIGRVGNIAYAVTFTVCGNEEVLASRLSLGLDGDTDDLTTAAYTAATEEITKAGFDYDQCRNFKAYNGGPLAGPVDVQWFVGEVEIDEETGESFVDSWKSVWTRGAGATAIPAEIVAAADKVCDAVWAAMEATVKNMQD